MNMEILGDSVVPPANEVGFHLGGATQSNTEGRSTGNRKTTKRLVRTYSTHTRQVPYNLADSPEPTEHRPVPRIQTRRHSYRCFGLFLSAC